MKENKGDFLWDDLPRSQRLWTNGGHGQSMFASAVGGVHGIATNANPVMVRWPLVENTDGEGNVSIDSSFSVSSWLDGFSKIIDDIVYNGKS